VSSPSAQTRRFATKKNDLIAQKEKEIADSAAAGAGEEARTRRFAGMRRDTWSGDRPMLGGPGGDSSGELDTVPAVPCGTSPVASPSASPAAGKVRKFASLKRENYKDL